MSITHIEQTETHPSRNYSSQHGWVTDRPKISSHEIAIPPFKHQKSLESLFKKTYPAKAELAASTQRSPGTPRRETLRFGGDFFAEESLKQLIFMFTSRRR
jgi:hypothetical protein